MPQQQPKTKTNDSYQYVFVQLATIITTNVQNKNNRKDLIHTF